MVNGMTLLQGVVEEGYREAFYITRGRTDLPPTINAREATGDHLLKTMAEATELVKHNTMIEVVWSGASTRDYVTWLVTGQTVALIHENTVIHMGEDEAMLILLDVIIVYNTIIQAGVIIRGNTAYVA